MRSLITGGSGFIGSHLVRHLLSLGHEILNIDSLTYAANPSSLQDVTYHPCYHFLQADVTDASALDAAFSQFRPETVFHLAAETHVDRSIHDPSPFLHSNIHGTYSLLQASTSYWRTLPRSDSVNPSSFRLLHVSTDEVYGQLDKHGVFRENSPFRPRSPYSASKAAADHLVHAWHITYGLPTLITRASNNYGPGQHQEKLIPTIIRSALQGLPIPIYGDGSHIRDWLYVEDHVEALGHLASKGTIGESYNIAGHNECSNLELARMICRILDKEAAGKGNTPSSSLPALPSGTSFEDLITFVADRPGHDFRYALDTSKIRHHLNWQPTTPFPSGIARTIKSFLPQASMHPAPRTPSLNTL